MTQGHRQFGLGLALKRALQQAIRFVITPLLVSRAVGVLVGGLGEFFGVGARIGHGLVGILCNDIENQPSPWPKGAQPSLPLWLANHPRCTPYDPASGEEARAIVLAGLRAPLGQCEGWFSMSLHRMPRCAVSSDNAHSCADDAALCRYSSGFSPVLRANQLGQLPTRRLRDWPRITQACLLSSRVSAMVITVYSGELRDGSAAFSASIHSCAALAVEAGMG